MSGFIPTPGQCRCRSGQCDCVTRQQIQDLDRAATSFFEGITLGIFWAVGIILKLIFKITWKLLVSFYNLAKVLIIQLKSKINR